MKALSDAGIRVVAISVDKPEKTREMMVQEKLDTFYGPTISAYKMRVISKFIGNACSFETN